MSDFVVSKNFTRLLHHVETSYLKAKILPLFVGDSIKLGLVIKEGNKERTQYFEGIIIGIQNTSLNKTIRLRRVLQGMGMERIFLIHSPKILSLEVLKSSRVRRSKLYYLRNLSGKASRLAQRFN